MFKYKFRCDCYLADKNEFCEFITRDSFFSLTEKYPVPSRCPYEDNESEWKLISVERI